MKASQFMAAHPLQSHKELEEGNRGQEFTERAKNMRTQMTLLLGAKRGRWAILTKGLQREISGHHLAIWCLGGAVLNYNYGRKESRHILTRLGHQQLFSAQILLSQPCSVRKRIKPIPSEFWVLTSQPYWPNPVSPVAL